jgi:uncharacterized protein YyaL (SSP411 family)
MKKIVLWICICAVLFAKDNFTNALINETSPYLQQHAHNPVHWYPWGKEALEKARREHKPVFLSIGYSTCHWCHVMEEESFTDTQVAKLLNDHFVSIKVDREEYPQLDKKYQRLYRALRGKRGGWPLSVFLTPDMQVIDIRTYIPKEEGYGSEGMLKLLPALVRLFQNPVTLQHCLSQNNRLITAQGKRQLSHSKCASVASLERRLTNLLQAQYDPKYGGFADHPKFPEASKLTLLLQLYRLYGNQAAYRMATTTLTKMAEGGIYDQIEGGFFRYTVDEAWEIPHFEKMLYSNAQLVSVYTDAYLLTQNPLYKRVVEETIAHMRKHYSVEGLFAGASDADSNGEEGGYFIDSYEAVKKALLQKGWKTSDIEEALAYLGIEEDGNIDGELSLAHIVSHKKPKKLEALKTFLRERRSRRDFPFVDTKINTAWNAMMVAALFEASKIDTRYGILAQKTLEKLWQTMRRDGVLYHQCMPHTQPTQKALLEDYAYLIEAYIAAYEDTYVQRYLDHAVLLGKEATKQFYRNGVWYLGNDGVNAKADLDDRYYTSPLSTMLNALLSIAALTEDLTLYGRVKEQIEKYRPTFWQDPAAASRFAGVLLRLKEGDVIVHAPTRLLRKAQKKLFVVRYPFVLSKVQAGNAYLLCKIDRCFGRAERIPALLEQLDRKSNTKRGSQWQKQ